MEPSFINQIKNVSISKIKIKRGRRAINKDKVSQIAESIITIGLLHPIVIDKQFFLVAGRHRLEAFKELKKKTIPAITTDKGLKAVLTEIDENLIREELSVLERGECLKKRKEIYEELYPQPPKCGPGRGHREKRGNNFPSFSIDAAQKLGKTCRTINPEELAKRLIRLYSFPEDLICDPFVGIGTTTACAASLNRRWLGIDINPKYCKMALKRTLKQ